MGNTETLDQLLLNVAHSPEWTDADRLIITAGANTLALLSHRDLAYGASAMMQYFAQTVDMATKFRIVATKLNAANERALAVARLQALVAPIRYASERGRRGAAVKLARDPKQAAMREAKKLWRDWQTGKATYKSGAAFAKYVCQRFPVLESQKNVERHVTKWRMEAAAKRKKQASS